MQSVTASSQYLGEVNIMIMIFIVAAPTGHIPGHVERHSYLPDPYLPRSRMHWLVCLS